jgi:hypothetical protein
VTSPRGRASTSPPRWASVGTWHAWTDRAASPRRTGRRVAGSPVCGPWRSRQEAPDRFAVDFHRPSSESWPCAIRPNSSVSRPDRHGLRWLARVDSHRCGSAPSDQEAALLDKRSFPFVPRGGFSLNPAAAPPSAGRSRRIHREGE